MTRKASILVVDDFPDVCAVLSGLLIDDGYSVQTANCLDEALTLLKTECFELAILDLQLDVSDECNNDGMRLAEEIRCHWPQTKVILLTGYATSKLLRRAVEPGQSLADIFLEKSELVHLLCYAEAVLR